MTDSQPLHILTTVAPFYNEEQGAQDFYTALLEALEPLEIALQFVFVDDGSSDNTLGILNAIAKIDERVTVLSLARNFGHQIALTAGLDFATGDAVVTLDSDLQHPPVAIREMVQAFRAGYSIVYGVRRADTNRGLGKRMVAHIFYSLLRRMTNVEMVEGAVDFRLMSRQVVDILRHMRETHRYLRGMVPWIGFAHTTVTYDQHSRHSGRAKYTWKKLAQLARYGLFSFSTVPLDMISWVGWALTVLAGLYLLYVIASAVFTPLLMQLPGWASLIAVLLVVSGVQLISMGILAQYIGMIFEQVKNRPLYTLKQVRLSRALREDAYQSPLTAPPFAGPPGGCHSPPLSNG